MEIFDTSDRFLCGYAHFHPSTSGPWWMWKKIRDRYVDGVSAADTLELVHRWFSRFGLRDLTDQGLIHAILDFVQNDMRSVVTANKLKLLIVHFASMRQMHAVSLQKIPDFIDVPIPRTTYTSEQMDSEYIADEFNAFSIALVKRLVLNTTLPQLLKSAEMELCAKLSNHISQHISSTLLGVSHERQRSKEFKFFVTVADHLVRRHQNFDAASAVVSALTSFEVERMSELSSSRLNALKYLVDCSNNYADYRAKVAGADANSVVPLLPVVRKDLVTMDSLTPDPVTAEHVMKVGGIVMPLMCVANAPMSELEHHPSFQSIFFVPSLDRDKIASMSDDRARQEDATPPPLPVHGGTYRSKRRNSFSMMSWRSRRDRFTAADISAELVSSGFSAQVAKIFVEQDIDGPVFEELTESDLVTIGIAQLGVRKRILKLAHSAKR